MARIFTSLADRELAALIARGAVGVLPTDTLYGLVAPAANRQAVTRLYALKSREQKPGTTIAASTEQLIQLGVEPTIVAQVARFWPAPLSIVLPQGDNLDYLHQGVGESPFRVVDDEALRAFLEQTGPLVTSSANQPGEMPASNLTEAQAYFGDQVDYYVDGGVRNDRQPSTIAGLMPEGHLQIFRKGAAQIRPEDQAN